MKTKIASLILLITTITSFAQTNFIRGDVNIKFNSKSTSTPQMGVKDVYTLNINFANSAIFHGTILDTPQIIDGWINKAVVQPRSLKYDIDCDVVNPHNFAQIRNIGRMYGNVPISSDGVYNYDNGSLVVDILPIGNAGGFTSKFGGIAMGKPLVRPANWMDTLQRQAVSISRSINGKTMTVTLKKYDKMEFRQHVVAEGPIQIYRPVTVNGEMLYDYDKNCWFFNNFTVQYEQNGDVKIDRITGTIRWVQDAHRDSNGLGEYDFDIRVNETAPDASSAFSAPTDESAFFSTDTTVAGLSGTMKYKDTINSSGETLASAVAIDLTGNNISKQQLMVLGKIIIFSSVVPMNSD